MTKRDNSLHSNVYESTDCTSYSRNENIKHPLSYDLVADNGKGDSFYDVHPYHTKVPVSIIVSLIEHYTTLGELILDPFCGSGSGGLAARITRRRFHLYDLS